MNTTFLRLSLIGLFLLFFSHMNAYAESSEFSISTRDGLSNISGEIDRPSCGVASYPVVIMVGGTGLFTRNASFGHSGTERDLLFKDLSQRLNSKCPNPKIALWKSFFQKTKT